MCAKAAAIAAVTCALALFAGSWPLQAAEANATSARYYRPDAAKKRYARPPLEVTIRRGRRIGGYSYSAGDVSSTYGRNPPPYMDVRQSPGGPFDSGFFFDSGISPRGGNSPYMR